MPKARARLATSPPMRPAPTRPSVLPYSSAPPKLLRSHAPSCIDRSAAGTRLTSASRSANVSSHAEIVLPEGAVSTATPFSVAASTSIVSTPTPARPMTLRRCARASESRVIFVALRTSTASTSAMAVARASPDSPGFVSSSKRASLRSGTSPSGAIASATSTLNDGLTTQAPARARPAARRAPPPCDRPCGQCESWHP